jgi:hypothetical protein
MTKLQKIVLGLVTVVTVSLLFAVVSLKSVSVGGVYQQYQKNFSQGLTVGTSNQLTIDSAGILSSSTSIKSSSASAGIGYATGAGCSVTQATSRTTGVTCTGVSGAITTNSASLAAGAEAEFTVTDTSVAAGDTVIASIASGQTAGTSVVSVTAVAAGSFKLQLTNLHAATADTGAGVINFAVIKAVSQ